ncbi:MAG: hypothetical protein ACLRSY_04520 [Acutalibacter sp.]
MPEDVVELLSVDMGCVGEGLQSRPEVSICAKDSGGRLRRHHRLGGGREGGWGRLRRGYPTTAATPRPP